MQLTHENFIKAIRHMETYSQTNVQFDSGKLMRFAYYGDYWVLFLSSEDIPFQISQWVSNRGLKMTDLENEEHFNVMMFEMGVQV